MKTACAEDRSKEAVVGNKVWRIMDCMVGWKKRLHKVNKRKLYVYGRNVQNSLSFSTVCEEFRPNSPRMVLREHVFEDNIALENQVKLISYSYKQLEPRTASDSFESTPASTSSSAPSTPSTLSTVSTASTVTSSNTADLIMSRDLSFDDVRYEDRTDDATDVNTHGCGGRCLCTGGRRRKPIKRIYSHSHAYPNVYKQINWQDWTMTKTTSDSQQKGRRASSPVIQSKEKPKLSSNERIQNSVIPDNKHKENQKSSSGLFKQKQTIQHNQQHKLYKRANGASKRRTATEEEGKKKENGRTTTQSKEFLSTHKEMSFQRLSRLYFDYNEDSDSENTPVNIEPSFSPPPHDARRRASSPVVDYSDRYKSNTLDFPHKHRHAAHFSSLTGSLKSVHHGGGSNRGSFQSQTGSLRSSGSPVPMNFIPGQLKPIVSKERLEKVPPLFGGIEKVIFCFKGITCRVEKSQPRTSKAIVHTGMMFLSMSAPTAHKCSY